MNDRRRGVADAHAIDAPRHAALLRGIGPRSRGFIAAAACDTRFAMPPYSEPEDGAASTLLHPHAPAAATITVREREGGTQAGRRGGAARGEEAVDRVDRYVILRELGRGGMGVVYAAYDTVLDRKVALKLLRDRVGGAEGHERMLREARALARLSHPNVVGIYEVGEVGERVFLAMELVDGISLRAWLQAQPRGPAEILAAFLQAAEGLAAAHAAGLVHRDFKPESSRFSLRTPSSRETPRISSLEGVGGKIGCPGLPLLAPG